jgi:transcriptional regulator with XRE-family HTH domain
MLNKAFAKTLREVRAKRGLSQEALSFQTDLHRTYISQLERGLKSPSLETLNQLCKALGISKSAFLKKVELEEKHHATS